MSWTSFALLNLRFSSLLAQLFTSSTQASPSAPAPAAVPSESEIDRRAKQQCAIHQFSKLTAYNTCIADAKKWLRNPPPPPAPVSALDREKALCSVSSGKTVAVEQCKREAPATLEARRKSAASAPSYTPLERRLLHCQTLGKTVVVEQCKREARAEFSK